MTEPAEVELFAYHADDYQMSNDLLDASIQNWLLNIIATHVMH